MQTSSHSIVPTQAFLLVQMRSLEHKGSLILPDAVKLHPHGEVIAVGPLARPDACGTEACFVPGDLVLFLAANMVMGFNEATPDECFILPASAVIGKYVKNVALES